MFVNYVQKNYKQKKISMKVCDYCNSDIDITTILGGYSICYSCLNRTKREGFNSSKHYKLRLFLKLAKTIYFPVVPEVFSYFIQSQAKWENIAREVWNQDKDCQWTDFYWSQNNKNKLKSVQKGPITGEFLSFLKKEINDS